jgi:hypothetical protein
MTFRVQSPERKPILADQGRHHIRLDGPTHHLRAVALGLGVGLTPPSALCPERVRGSQPAEDNVARLSARRKMVAVEVQTDDVT